MTYSPSLENVKYVGPLVLVKFVINFDMKMSNEKTRGKPRYVTYQVV